MNFLPRDNFLQFLRDTEEEYWRYISSTLTNAIVTPGGEHDGSAHRAELSENYDMVLLGSVTLRCDGQSALYRSFSDLVDEPSFNLITTIHNFLRN